MSYRDSSAPDARIYLGTSGKVLCVDGDTGEVRWTTEIDGANEITLLVDGGLIFVGTHGMVACLDLDGNVLWNHSCRLIWPITLSLDMRFPEGRLYVAGAGLLYALSTTSGRELWANGLKGLRYSPISLRVPGARASAGAVTRREGKNEITSNDEQGAGA
ncbi:MAG: PQQ-like beta-propeller repeat protein [Deltaproteobacteria bacterium]|nr:PQQ-like beta-propeller repeat protein [Deltaproteobacteria bacterium]